MYRVSLTVMIQILFPVFTPVGRNSAPKKENGSEGASSKPLYLK